MPIPAVKGYKPLCVTLRSQVCDEQGIGQWPMWKRYDSVKGIIDQFVDEPYRDFLALPYYDVDKQKSEEYFYWFTPRSDAEFVRLSKAGADHDFYKSLLDKTLAHYHSVLDRLKNEGLAEEANFLQLSLKYAGDSESNVYCGDNRVVATVWGMRPRDGFDFEESIIFADLFPEKELHIVRFELGVRGTTDNPTELKKSHGSRIEPHQVPLVRANDGCDFLGWDRNPIGVEVKSDLSFTAQYKEQPKPKEEPKEKSKEDPKEELKEDPKEEPPITHHIRFLTPDGQVIIEFDAEHGKRIGSDYIPQLPVVDGVVCTTWDGDPMNDVVNDNRDYKAIAPAPPDTQKHTVRFLLPDGKVITQFLVEHGTRLTPGQVPPLPVVDGETCSEWNADPMAESIVEDRDFTAQKPERKEPVKSGRGGLWHALLNWLLLALGLLLLFLLLWLILLGHGHYDFCGCGCTDPVVRPIIPTNNVIPDDNVNPDDKVIPPPVLRPCDEVQKSGSNTPESFIVDMGQNSGSFEFDYFTGNYYPDLIVIYDGEDNKGEEIFRFFGLTDEYEITKTIQFHKPKIYIEVIPDGDSGTAWSFMVHCPND
ncbi:MAG: hypothetical protein KBT57_01105 [bacterium]|nr:hypothetical protein [Candidatus Limimorpha equi]